MTAPIRPPPRVLIIHDGNSVDTYLTYLRTAGLHAEESHASDAVTSTVASQPDIIVLDYDCDGEIIAALQGDQRTRNIPVIAMADLPPARGG